MILVTCSSVTVEKEANVGGGESGVMCRKLSEVEKIECIFFNFFCKELDKSVSQKLWRVYRWENLCWDSV